MQGHHGEVGGDTFVRLFKIVCRYTFCGCGGPFWSVDNVQMWGASENHLMGIGDYTLRTLVIILKCTCWQLSIMVGNEVRN